MPAKDLDDLLKQFERFEFEVIQAAPGIAAEIVGNLLALRINAIHKVGISTDKGSGFQYSTNPMLATKSQFHNTAAFEPTEISVAFITKEGKRKAGGERIKSGKNKGSINQRRTKKIFMWIKFKGAKKAVPVMMLPGGYKQLRSIQGDESGFVNLTYTGRMFQNTKIVRYVRTGYKFSVEVGATQKEEQKKLFYNTLHYGNFLKPQQDELEAVQDIPHNRILAIAQKIFV